MRGENPLAIVCAEPGRRRYSRAAKAASSHTHSASLSGAGFSVGFGPQNVGDSELPWGRIMARCSTGRHVPDPQQSSFCGPAVCSNRASASRLSTASSPLRLRRTQMSSSSGAEQKIGNLLPLRLFPRFSICLQVVTLQGKTNHREACRESTHRRVSLWARCAASGDRTWSSGRWRWSAILTS